MRLIDADALVLKINGRTNLIPTTAGLLQYENEFGKGISLCMGDIKDAPTVQPVITGETSDGYHTFNELYHHRAVLFSVIVKAFPERAWKARKHHDGTMYDGMFIVGIETPEGQATYHYDIEPYWDMFNCPEREFAPKWDGHTAAQAIERIGKLEPVRHGRWEHVKKHLWYRDSKGRIDEWYLDHGFHNGPCCKVCDEMVCVHCEPDWAEQECKIGYFVCSSCGQSTEYGATAYCPNCGVKMDAEVKT